MFVLRVLDAQHGAGSSLLQSLQRRAGLYGLVGGQAGERARATEGDDGMTVEQLQAEIARLHAVRNKVEAGYTETVAQLQAQLAAIRETVGDTEFSLRQQIAALTAERGACLWTETKDGQCETACGQMHEFVDGGPSDNRMQFCGYCGKGLVEQRWSEAGDGRA